MKINWKVRIANKTFWITLIPALALLVTTVASVFGIQLELSDLADKLLKVVSAVFAVLAILGIVNDPTTNGIKDSDRAMGYEEPWVDIPEEKKQEV